MNNIIHKISCILILIGSFSTIQAQVVLNEFSAANYSTTNDNFGDNSDWIELYNTGSSTVDLGGYYLSDRIDNPTKWTFPAGTSINANGFLRVWASGKNVVANNNVHTSFKLTQTKASEQIAFSDPSGTLLDSHEFVPNQTNHSTARKLDGTGDWAISTNPTPNNSNDAIKARYAATPIMDMQPGYYDSGITISLASTDATAVIHYTTNGVDPSASSQVYSSPIDVNTTTIVRAIAIHPDSDIIPSFIESNTYFIGTESKHTIPVVSISGDGVDNLMGGDWDAEPEGTFELFDESQVFLDEGTGNFNKHGNDSWAYGQRGIDYICRDQFGYNHAVQHEIFPTKNRSKYKRLMLKAAANDNYSFEDGAHVRDGYLHHLSQLGDLRLDERSYEPCILYVDGEYWGVYELREKVDDHDFTDHYYNQPKDSIQFIKTWGGTWAEYGGNQALNDWNTLYNFIIGNDMSDPANYAQVKAELNTGSLIDYMIINTQAVCTDWLNYNTGWWRGLAENGDKKKWRYILWDLDASFGHYINYTGIPDDSPEADPCDNESPQIDDPEGHTEMLTALLESEEFYTDYINRYADLNNTIFSCEYMVGLLTEMINRIEPEMQRQIDRWGGSYQGWQNAVIELRTFIEDRCTAIDEGIVDCYEVEGPFPFHVIVDPPMAGEVEINNSIQPSVYAWSGEYFGGLDISLNAKPLPGYQFVSWELSNQTLLPDNVSDPVSFSFEVADTVIAYFEPIHIDLTILVDVPGSGLVELNGDELSAFPWTTGALMYGTEINLTALAEAGYGFEYWSSSEHDFDTDETSLSTSFILMETDTIIAHFIQLDAPADITVIVDPPLSGDIDFNGTIPTTYPSTETYYIGEDISFGAIAAAGFSFSNWEMTTNTGVPDNFTENIGVNIVDTDTIIAHFIPAPLEVTVLVNPPLAGDVSVNGVGLTNYPWTNPFVYGDVLDLEALASSGFVFESWTLNNNTISPSTNNAIGTVNLTANDTIVANFTTQVFTVTINIEGGGQIDIDGTLADNLFSQDYAGGVTLDINALAEDGYQFDGWTWNGNNSTDPNLPLTLTEDVVLTASFSLIPATVTVSIPDENAGFVLVNGEMPDNYPYEVEVPIGDLLNLIAQAEEGYVFDHWEVNGVTLDENATLEEIALSLSQGDVITAIFVEQPPECFMRMPTAFTPNGDGLNDEFRLLEQYCSIESFNLQIFNRWGKKVFETQNIEKGWDGFNHSGIGNYVWQMDYTIIEDDQVVSKTEQGNIILLK